MPNETSEFDGKLCIVTGASSGIGRATARLLAQRGATVIAVARRADRLHGLEEESGSTGEIVAAAGDLTDDGFRAELIETARGSGDGLDVLVNAAGILEVANWEATDLDDWDRSMDINVRTVYGLTRYALPLLNYFDDRGVTVRVGDERILA